MDRDTLVLIAIAAGSAASVGAISLAFAYALRRRSLRWDFALVALSAVLAMVAGFVGTARAMFLSSARFRRRAVGQRRSWLRLTLLRAARGALCCAVLRPTSGGNARTRFDRNVCQTRRCPV